MEIITICIFLSLGLILFVLSKYLKDFIFLFSSGTILLIVGLSIMISGFDVQNGFTDDYDLVEDTGNQTGTVDRVYTYQTIDTIETHGLGVILIWLALYVLLIGKGMYEKEKEINNDGGL